MARQRYCRRLARYRNTLRVSANPVAKPAADTRAESRGSRPSKADAGERRTVCWREVDSNLRSPFAWGPAANSRTAGENPLRRVRARNRGRARVGYQAPAAVRWLTVSRGGSRKVW